ncbi:sarcosine oxidase subunit gamma [Specibacter sp. NPDC057265]|uniref:sarcosine oxidase subunit gamma n=1 Tax=Specibacter sp. NPDC057265 TaxID=3346075 RepID=UPI003628E84A
MNTANVQARRHSPAEHLWTDFQVGTVGGEYGVSLREVPFQAMVGIRVDPLSHGGQRIAALIGALPATSGQVTHGGADSLAPEASTLWLAPDEFLVVAPDEPTPGTLAAALVAALGDTAGQVIDLSSNRTTFELSGPSARAVLEKSCAADLHPRTLTAGTAITTEINKIPTVLWKTGDETFQIFPRASFADYLGRWLLDGMREFASGGAPWH